MNNKAGVSAQRRRTRAEIERLVAEFADSGLNRTEFCRRHGMSLGTLNRHPRREREDVAEGAAHRGLVAVELAGMKFTTDSHARCGLAVVLSRGRRIEVEAGFDGPTLQRLLQLLEVGHVWLRSDAGLASAAKSNSASAGLDFVQSFHCANPKRVLTHAMKAHTTRVSGYTNPGTALRTA